MVLELYCRKAGEREKVERERDQPCPRGEKGERRERRKARVRGRVRGRESKRVRGEERRVRGVRGRERGGAKQLLLWFAVIFTVAR